MAAESQYERMAADMLQRGGATPLEMFSTVAALLFIGEQLQNIAVDGVPDFNFVGTLDHQLTPGELVIGGTDMADILDAVQGAEVRLTISRIGDDR